MLTFWLLFLVIMGLSLSSAPVEMQKTVDQTPEQAVIETVEEEK